MPKQKAGNLHKFGTEELYQLLSEKTFGELLDPEIVKAMTKEVLSDYVNYKLHVYRGCPP